MNEPKFSKGQKVLVDTESGQYQPVTLIDGTLLHVKGIVAEVHSKKFTTWSRHSYRLTLPDSDSFYFQEKDLLAELAVEFPPQLNQSNVWDEF